jgi:hypothetical protein
MQSRTSGGNMVTGSSLQNNGYLPAKNFLEKKNVNLNLLLK